MRTLILLSTIFSIFFILNINAATDESDYEVRSVDEELTQIFVSSVPGDVSIQCSEEIPSNNPFASTDCGNGALTRIITFDSQIDGCVNVLTKTWTYTNPCGDEVAVHQIITIEDITPPWVFNPPLDMVLNCGSPIPPIVSPQLYDNCAEFNLGVTFNEAIVGTDCPVMITRTWTATDYCGLTTVFEQTIQFVDESLDCPLLDQNIGGACDDNNPSTENDIVTADCDCQGTAICEADFTLDGTVDVEDFLLFNSKYGTDCACPEDLNADGAVDITDFLQFNSSYGSTCE